MKSPKLPLIIAVAVFLFVALGLFFAGTDKDADRAKVFRRFTDFRAGGKTELGCVRSDSGSIGDMLGGLMGGSTNGISTKSRVSIKVPSETDIDMGSGNSSRSKAEILAVVKARTPGLQNVYNKYFKLKPGFAGKVTLKFTINQEGNITSISIASSTTGYVEFDEAVKNMVSTWKWKSLEKKAGNTTLTIPFNFDIPGDGWTSPVL